MSGFYGNPIVARRLDSWGILRQLKPSMHVPCLYMGDFNEIIAQDEKSGAASRPYKQMEHFREALEDGGLCDLGFMGLKFTWSNKRDVRDFTRERLDRAIGNKAWIMSFDNSNVHTLLVLNSDHSPMFISYYMNDRPASKRNRLFRCEDETRGLF